VLLQYHKNNGSHTENAKLSNLQELDKEEYLFLKTILLKVLESFCFKSLNYQEIAPSA